MLFLGVSRRNSNQNSSDKSFIPSDHLLGNIDISDKKQEAKNKVVQEDAQEVQVTSGIKGNVDNKANGFLNSTQNSTNFEKMKPFGQVNDKKLLPQLLKSEKVFATANIDDDPPQWLIEEALKMDNMYSEDKLTVPNDFNKNISAKLKYEEIISELEDELKKTKVAIEEALKEKYDEKEKFESDLRRIEKEANKKNEILQAQITHICTFILKKFGVNSSTEKRDSCVKRTRIYRKFSKGLHTRLRNTVIKLNRVKHELVKNRKTLVEKNHKYETLKVCFSRLKKELLATDRNLNNLITENTILRKKFEDAREFVENKVSKDHHEHYNNARFHDMQKSRELTNLKKKVEQDCSIINELRNKLHRSESANTNKGFLMNSYKNQITEITKERDQFSKKAKELENENNSLRTKNSKLKGKISLLDIEKEKPAPESEKSVNDVHDEQKNMDLQNEKFNLKEMEKLDFKVGQILEDMKMKVEVLENYRVEYNCAIKEFLKQIYKHYCENNDELETNYAEESEREAHETACSILNITPKQLSQFLKGKPDSVNCWLSDLCKITSKKQFSGSLAKFLFKKAVQKNVA